MTKSRPFGTLDITSPPIPSMDFIPPTPLETTPADLPQGRRRRVHHHKKSLSHSFFSFQDPTVPPISADVSVPPSPSVFVTPDYSTPQRQQQQFKSSSLSNENTPDALSFVVQFTIAIAFCLQTILAIVLWAKSEECMSLSVTALAYLSLFNAFSLSRYLIVLPLQRFSYTSVRIRVLYSYGHMVYLLFCALYITKEVIHHIILSPGSGDFTEWPALEISVSFIFFGASYWFGVNNDLSTALNYKFDPFTPFLLVLSVINMAIALIPSLQKLDLMISIACLAVIVTLSIPAIVDLSKILLLKNPDNNQINILKTNLENLVKQLGTNVQLGHCRCWTISTSIQSKQTEISEDVQNFLSPKAIQRRSSKSSLLQSAPSMDQSIILSRPVFFALEFLVPRETSDTKLIQDTLRAQRIVDESLAGHTGSEAIVVMKRNR